MILVVLMLLSFEFPFAETLSTELPGNEQPSGKLQYLFLIRLEIFLLEII